MARVQNPHFTLPFDFVADPDTDGNKKTAQVAEQGSTPDLVYQTLALFLCPENYRDDLPEYGMPSPLFHQTPLDLDAQRQAVARWVPDVDVFISEGADIIDQAVRHMQVNVSESRDEG